MSTSKIRHLGRYHTTNFFTSYPAPAPASLKTPQFRRIPRRFFTTTPPLNSTPPNPPPSPAPPSPPPTPISNPASKPYSRDSPNISTHTPPPLLTAPKTYIISFLILHEITAIIPLLLLGGGFHYTGWLPSDLIPEERLEAARGRFERWFGKKGWFGYESAGGNVDKLGHDGQTVMRAEENNTSGKRIVLEVATAYVITKVLLPVRIAVCVWGTPWFAGIVGRIGRLVK